jgi:hypothetical protein
VSQREAEGLHGMGSRNVERCSGTQTLQETVLAPKVCGWEEKIFLHCSVTVVDRVVVSINFLECMFKLAFTAGLYRRGSSRIPAPGIAT